MVHHNRLHTKEFMVGAAVGSLLGSVAALLVAPKAGKMLRDDLYDVYCNVTDKTHDLANRGKSLAKDIGCQTCDWADKARSMMNGATRTAKDWVPEMDEENTTRDVLIGGLIGGVLGAAIGLLLAPKPGEALRQDLVDAYEDISERTHDFADDVTKRGKTFAKKAGSKANKWIDLAKHIIEDLNEGAQEKGEDWVDQVKGLVGNKRMNDILDWAQLGYRVWQGAQSKRR